jgi:Fic family protein
MNTPRAPLYAWQRSTWAVWKYDNQALAGTLAQARLHQGLVIGKAQAVGMQGEAFALVVNEIWVQEVIATAAIEGQKLDLDQVRSSVMRMLGIADAGAASRHVDGLVAVMQDALQHFAVPLNEDRLCRWQSALFPGGTSGIKRIDVGRYRTFVSDP